MITDTPPAATRTRNRRVLITGSRTWPWPTQVARVLDAERDRLPSEGTLTVVHGACPQGADAAAAAWCARVKDTPGAGVVEAPHPARWRDQRGHVDRAAGVVRNAAMVESGPDLVIAFWADHSDGTANTLRRAAQARIPAVVYTAYSTPPAPTTPDTTDSDAPDAPDAPAEDAVPEPATRRTAGRPAIAGARRGRKPTADEQADQTLSQGYTADNNPVCPTCREQKSNTGQCACP